MAVEFQVLGGIQARVNGHLVDLGHARQCLLLAALLVDANREVSPGQLAERIWGREHAQRGTLYSYLPGYARRWPQPKVRRSPAARRGTC